MLFPIGLAVMLTMLLAMTFRPSTPLLTASLGRMSERWLHEQRASRSSPYPF